MERRWWFVERKAQVVFSRGPMIHLSCWRGPLVHSLLPCHPDGNCDVWEGVRSSSGDAGGQGNVASASTE